MGAGAGAGAGEAVEGVVLRFLQKKKSYFCFFLLFVRSEKNDYKGDNASNKHFQDY